MEVVGLICRLKKVKHTLTMPVGLLLPHNLGDLDPGVSELDLQKCRLSGMCKYVFWRQGRETEGGVGERRDERDEKSYSLSKISDITYAFLRPHFCKHREPHAPHDHNVGRELSHR